MANLIKLLLDLAAVHAVFILTGVMDLPGSALYTLMTGVEGWSTNTLIKAIGNIAIGVGAAIVIAGTILPGKHELAIFAGAFTVLLTYGAGFLKLWTTVFNLAEGMFGAGAGTAFTTIFIGPLFLIYLWVCVDWWKGRAD